MNQSLKYFGQGLVYLVFMGSIGYCSNAPSFTHLGPGQAVIKFGFHHYGQFQSECHRRSAEELAHLPPNMRATLDCPRARAPVTVELDLDETPLYRGVQQPSGLHHDGVSYLYQRFTVPASTHRLRMRLNDRLDETGFRYVLEREVTLAPAQVLVINFRPEKGGFIVEP
ncbi:conserved hypothetical protein [Gammaproteobacteria bacterium]